MEHVNQIDSMEDSKINIGMFGFLFEKLNYISEYNGDYNENTVIDLINKAYRNFITLDRIDYSFKKLDHVNSNQINIGNIYGDYVFDDFYIFEDSINKLDTMCKAHHIFAGELISELIYNEVTI